MKRKNLEMRRLLERQEAGCNRWRGWGEGGNGHNRCISIDYERGHPFRMMQVYLV